MTDGANLITGAGGFIGAHLVERLVALNEPLHVMVRRSTALDRVRPTAGRLRIHRVDLADREALGRHIREIAPRRVFHLAADTSLHTAASTAFADTATQNYLKPTLNLVEALAALETPPAVVVRAGTIAEHGQVAMAPGLSPRHAPDRHLTAYGEGMLATTARLAALAPQLPFRVITARLALCYGPGQARSFLIPALIDACLLRRPLTVERPADRRDLLYVGEAVDALVQLADAPPSDYATLDIGTGTAPSMDTVASLIEGLTGCPPGFATRGRYAPGDVARELRADTTLARDLLGWESRIDLATGLATTIAAETNKHLKAS